jgi:hypothetical protein
MISPKGIAGYLQDTDDTEVYRSRPEERWFQCAEMDEPLNGITAISLEIFW